MRVRHIMTPSPAYCLPLDSSQKAAQLMALYDTGFLPVVETLETRRLVGVVTDRDLCLAIMARGQSPATTPVSVSMTRSVISCRLDDDVKKVEILMREHLIRRIVVTEGGQAVRGIVSIADVLVRSDTPAQEAWETVRPLSQPTREESRPRGARTDSEANTSVESLESRSQR